MSVRPSKLASTLKRALKYEQTSGGAGMLELDAELVGQEEDDHNNGKNAAGGGYYSADRPFLKTRPSSALERQRIKTDQERRARRKVEVEKWTSDEMRNILSSHPYLSTVVVSPPIQEEDGRISRTPQPLHEALHAHQIDGKSLLELSSTDIRECFGVKQVGIVKGVIRHIQQLLDPNLDLDSFIEETLSLQPAPGNGATEVRSSIDSSSTFGGGVSTPSTRPSSAAINVMATGKRPGSALSTTTAGTGRPSSAVTVAAAPSSLPPAGGSSTHVSSLNPFPYWEQEHDAIMGNWGGAQLGGPASRPASGKASDRHLPSPVKARNSVTEKSGGLVADQEYSKQHSAVVLSAAESTRQANAELLALLDDVGDFQVAPQPEPLPAEASVGCQTVADAAELYPDLKREQLSQMPAMGLMEHEKRYTLITDLHETLQAGLDEGMSLGWLINVAYYNLPEGQRSVNPEDGDVSDLTEWIATCGAKLKQRRKERRELKRAKKKAARDKEREEQGLPPKERRNKGELKSVPSFSQRDGEGGDDSPKKRSRERTARFVTEQKGEGRADSPTKEEAAGEEDASSDDEHQEQEGGAPEAVAATEKESESRRLRFDEVNDPEMPQAATTLAGGVSAAHLERYAGMHLSLDEYRETVFDLTNSLDIPSFDHFAKAMSQQHGKAKIESVRRRTAVSLVFDRCPQDDYGVISDGFMLELVLEYCNTSRKQVKGALPRSNEEWLELFDRAGGFFLGSERPRPKKHRGVDGAASVSASQVPSSISRSPMPRIRSSVVAGGTDSSINLPSNDDTPVQDQPVWNSINFVGFVYEALKADSSEDFDMHMLQLKTIVERMISSELGFDKMQISHEDLVATFMPKTDKTRPLVVCYSSVVDPGVLVENTFRSCRDAASTSKSAVGSRPGTGNRRRSSSVRPTSAKPTTTAGGEVIAPSVRQRKLLVYSVASAESEDLAIRSIERDGIALGSWIYVSFPRNSIDKPVLPFDEEQQEDLMGDAATESGSVWSMGSATETTISTMSSSNGVVLTGKMNEFLRKVARLLTTRRAALVHERFRLFCHCPLDFIDDNNVPTLARSVCVFVPLLQEKARLTIPHALSPERDHGAEDSSTPQKQVANNQNSEASPPRLGVAPLPDVDGTLTAVPLSPQKLRPSPSTTPQKNVTKVEAAEETIIVSNTTDSRSLSPNLFLLEESTAGGEGATEFPMLTLLLNSVRELEEQGGGEEDHEKSTGDEKKTQGERPGKSRYMGVWLLRETVDRDTPEEPLKSLPRLFSVLPEKTTEEKEATGATQPQKTAPNEILGKYAGLGLKVLGEIIQPAAATQEQHQSQEEATDSTGEEVKRRYRGLEILCSI